MLAAVASCRNWQATPHSRVEYVTIVFGMWKWLGTPCIQLVLCTEYLQPCTFAVYCPAEHMAHETAGFAAPWNLQWYTAFAQIAPQQSQVRVLTHATRWRAWASTP